MKTTVEIQDALLEEVRVLADARATTLRSLVEEGLRLVLQKGNTAPFRLPDCSYAGDGMEERFADAPWAVLRGAIYEKTE